MNTQKASPQSNEAENELLHALRKCDPSVIGDATLREIEGVLNTIEPESLDNRLLSGLDMYYKSITRRLLSHPEDDADLQAFDRHMAKQLSYRFQAQLSNSTKMYQVRWDLMKEMVADQRIIYQQAKENTSLQALMRKKHMFNILDIVARHYDRGLYQRDIGVQLNIAKSTVSTIINRLVESRLVRKTDIGKENCIIATVEGRKIWEAINLQKELNSVPKRPTSPYQHKQGVNARAQFQQNQKIAG